MTTAATSQSHVASVRIPIFRAGTHTAADGRRVTFTQADLHEIAQGYNPTLQRAPHVIGHPEIDAPAYGWAKSLTVDGDLLVADSDQVEPQFAQMVNEGRFPNRSASFYLPDTPGNPTPGRKYLKHVGWLGATPPAVSGLAAVKFSAESASAVSFSLPADFAGQQSSESVDMDKDELERAQAALKQQQDDLAAQLAKLAKDKEALQFSQKTLADEAAAATRAKTVEFAQGLVKAGKLLPAEEQPIVELLLALPANDKPLSFSQAGTTVSRPAGDVLRDLLGALPTRIDYREKSAHETVSAAVSFAAPRDALVDPTRADLYAQATQYQAKNPNVSWVDAVKACGG